MQLFGTFHLLQEIRKPVKIIKSHFLYRGNAPCIHHVHIGRKLLFDKITVIEIFPHDTVIAFRITFFRRKLINFTGFPVHDAGGPVRRKKDYRPFRIIFLKHPLTVLPAPLSGVPSMSEQCSCRMLLLFISFQDLQSFLTVLHLR